MVPRMFDWCTSETTLARSVITELTSDRSSRPSSVSPNHRRVAPVLAASSCQGTRLEWCSISVTTISSPAPRMNRSAPSGSGAPCAALAVAFENAYATRLSDSVAFFVKTRSWERAPTNAAMVPRAPSYASVASSASWCAPRCTAALCCS